jgi:proline iminopeptidase
VSPITGSATCSARGAAGSDVGETGLLVNVGRVRHLPCIIAHGRYDVATPVSNAWDLARAWPQASLTVVGDAGRAMTEPGFVHELVGATRRFAAPGRR